MAFLSPTELILVFLNEALDRWFQLLDSALANLLNLIGLPSLSPDLLRSEPGLALLLELTLELFGLVTDQFLMDGISLFALLDKVLNFDRQTLLVLDQILYRLELLLNPLGHLCAYFVGLFRGLFLCPLQAGLELAALSLSDLFEKRKGLLGLLLLKLKL